MARGKRTDPAAAVLAKVMHEMGFELRLISTASGLARGTVKDIVEGNGPWRQMPQTELFEITRLRLLRAIDESLYDLGMKAMGKLEERMKTASFSELIGIMDVALRRLAEFAKETCLSEGDLLRLTDDMIHREKGFIVPDGGRKKTDVEQVSPLTARARAIVDEIKAERRSRAVVPLNGLVFTREDGRRITKDMIQAQVEKAIKKTGVKKLTFHNYRNTALTEWARRGIHVDVAMKASGHSSVQMHKRYVDLQANDVANAFGTAEDSKIVTGIVT